MSAGAVQFFLARFRQKPAGTTYNPEQRHSSAYHKERRAEKKSRGECLNCKNLARPGLTRCDACTAPKGNGWCLDHDHAALKFRGILCQNCNSMLGGAHDCVLILLKAIKYLRRMS